MGFLTVGIEAVAHESSYPRWDDSPPSRHGATLTVSGVRRADAARLTFPVLVLPYSQFTSLFDCKNLLRVFRFVEFLLNSS